MKRTVFLVALCLMAAAATMAHIFAQVQPARVGTSGLVPWVTTNSDWQTYFAIPNETDLPICVNMHAYFMEHPGVHCVSSVTIEPRSVWTGALVDLFVAYDVKNVGGLMQVTCDTPVRMLVLYLQYDRFTAYVIETR